MALNRNVIGCHLHGINDRVYHAHQGPQESVIKRVPVHQKGRIASEIELDIGKGI